MDAQTKMGLFEKRRAAEAAGDQATVFDIDGEFDAEVAEAAKARGIDDDEAGRHDWRVDYLRWERWDEYPNFCYCDVCDGLLFADEVGSRQCRD